MITAVDMSMEARGRHAVRKAVREHERELEGERQREREPEDEREHDMATLGFHRASVDKYIQCISPLVGGVTIFE